MKNDKGSVTLIVPGRLPSWNAILSLSHWQRHRLKKKIQADFLSALRASGNGFSTLTISAKNTMSIASATLASYLLTRRTERTSKSRKGSAEKAKVNTSSS